MKQTVHGIRAQSIVHILSCVQYIFTLQLVFTLVPIGVYFPHDTFSFPVFILHNYLKN